MSVIYLKTEGEPVPKSRPRFSVIKGHPHAYTPQKTVDAEETLKWLLRGKVRGAPDSKSLFFVRLVFACVDTKTDGDNLEKLVLDACTGIVWEDDRQVAGCLWHVLRVAANPSTDIAISTECLWGMEAAA